jgi:hypothetical protein
MNNIFKLLRIVIFFTLSNCVAQSNLELKIIDSKIENDKWLNVELINNSKFDYCFVMDTIRFWRDEPFAQSDFFLNPDVVLYDIKSKRKVTEMISVSTSQFDDKEIKHDNNFVLYVKPQLITLKKHHVLKLKIPFSLIKKSILFKDENLCSYYKINKNNQYDGRIEYMITSNFIKKYFDKNVLDSLSIKGYNMFTGKLVSNKVPLILK